MEDTGFTQYRLAKELGIQPENLSAKMSSLTLLLHEMNMKIHRLLTCMALLAFSPPTLAAEGPYVPCPGCEQLQHAPYPESGLWFNPEKPGTGYVLEIQNGHVAGFRFAYRQGGDPDWWIFSGSLERSDDPGVLWILDYEARRFCEDGTDGCLPPESVAETGSEPARLEFLQRAYARSIRGGEEVEYLVPYTYGSVSRAYFPGQTPYLLPELTPDPGASLWIFAFKEPGEEEIAPWDWHSIVLTIREALIPANGPNAGKLVYSVGMPVNPPEGSVGFGNIVCGPDGESGELMCFLNPGEENEYRIPLGNFTDSRLFGERADGGTVEGFRLRYD
jgi:hypothetical protein